MKRPVSMSWVLAITALGFVGCTNNKVDERLTALEAGQKDAVLRDKELYTRIDAVGQDVQKVQNQVVEVQKTVEAVGALTKQIDARLAKAEEIAAKFLEARKDAPAAMEATPGVEDYSKHASEAVKKLLDQYGDALGLTAEQRPVLAKFLEQTLVSVAPTLVAVKQGKVEVAEVQDKLLAELEKLVDNLYKDGRLTTQQIEQVREGMPNVLKRLVGK